MLLFPLKLRKVHVFVFCFQALHLYHACIGVFSVFLTMTVVVWGIKPCKLVINYRLSAELSVFIFFTTLKMESARSETR